MKYLKDLFNIKFHKENDQNNQLKMHSNKYSNMHSNDISNKHKNAGMTMVEVLIGFVILVLLLEGLFGIIRFSHRMYMRSVDLKAKQEVLNENLYKKNVLDDANCLKTSINFNIVNPPSKAGGATVLLPAKLVDGTAVEMNLELYEIQSYKLDGSSDRNSDEINMNMYLFKKG